MSTFGGMPTGFLNPKIECPICLTKKTACVTTKCGHTFCGDCLLKWEEENNTCPLCRGELYETNENINKTIYIYLTYG